MQQYTALYVMPGFFYRQDIITFNISNHYPSRQIHMKTHQQLGFNTSKAGLFEGSFSWEGGQFDSPPAPFIFQEERV